MNLRRLKRVKHSNKKKHSRLWTKWLRPGKAPKISGDWEEFFFIRWLNLEDERSFMEGECCFDKMDHIDHSDKTDGLHESGWPQTISPQTWCSSTGVSNIQYHSFTIIYHQFIFISASQSWSWSSSSSSSSLFGELWSISMIQIEIFISFDSSLRADATGLFKRMEHTS